MPVCKKFHWKSTETNIKAVIYQHQIVEAFQVNIRRNNIFQHQIWVDEMIR